MYNKYKDVVLSEIDGVLSKINTNELDDCIDLILSSNKIVMAGAGRMGYSIKCFAMRLSHVGLNTYSLGDSTVPYTDENDLLVMASGSGETPTMLEIAKKAKSHNCKILLFTTNTESSIAKLSDMIVEVPGVSSFTGDSGTIQPMKTYIEQSTLILYDVLSLLIMDRLGKTNDDLSKNHSILE